ncbi:transcription factor IIIC subunit delta N-term-domain-containing protein [Xylariomycetidae sp. FL2044]|nr:transcription factor IIIC subunit delta N-term-domain-containing protein [Xylariomycetidae sp. FL2044]
MSSNHTPTGFSLQPIELRALPRCTHNISWSPDAELAIGCDDCVTIYLPNFAGASNTSDPPLQYRQATLRFPPNEVRSPELNRPLFSVVDQDMPEFEHIVGGGSGVITSQGSSLNHIVALEWSSSGLGRMKRPVLAVLSGDGKLSIYCEGAPGNEGSSFKSKGRASRSLRPWVVAWCIGGDSIIPRADGHDSPFSRENITAFAWAKDFDGNGALLAYQNDEDVIAIVSIQSSHPSSVQTGHPGEWRVEEVARFSAEGPHPLSDPTDPDYTPSGSSFALSWGPWMKKGDTRTCMISYLSKNYVGFRQITIQESEVPMKEAPKVEVSPTDVSGVCLFLAPDAFVVWEDLVWTINNSKVCRGIIATPFRVQAFQLSFDSAWSIMNPHSTEECNTTYPPESDSQSTNPIVGLVIHPPSVSLPTSTPLYTLARLSATHENGGWHQTNLPLPPNPEQQPFDLQWAQQINQMIEHRLPRADAYRGDTQSDDDEEEDSSSEPEYSSDEGGGDSDPDADDDNMIDYFMGKEDAANQVHTTRIRIWGIASSPGGGTTAVFASLHSGIRFGRDTYGGIRCKVFFGRRRLDDGDQILSTKKLSTEARVWEWMFGGGPPIDGIGGRSGARAGGPETTEQRIAIQDHFKVLRKRLRCVFCEAELVSGGSGKRANASVCSRGHMFDNCATTGVPILEPGISRNCGVCGFKCLKPDVLMAMAPQLERIITDEISTESCGGCGGKFVNG